QLTEDPWEQIEAKYTPETRHKGIVKNLTPYGVFVELEPGIGGMIHISDLSWTKRFNHPSEFVKVDQEIEVIVLSLDKETRKLSLGHKQIEEDPWSNFETVFPVGSTHQGKVIRKDDKGAVVQLEHGLEAFAPTRHLKKEDGKSVDLDETNDFVVIEFDMNEKRIMVSHARVWEQAAADEKEAEVKAQHADAESTKKAVKNIQAKVEKPTLCDLDALSNLKDKLKAEEDNPSND